MTTGTSEETGDTLAAGGPAWLTPAFVALGVGAGLLVHLGLGAGPQPSPGGAAVAAFALFAAGSFALIFDAARWREQALFALGLGAVEAGLAFNLAQAGRPNGDFAPAAAIALGLIAVPLFQSGAHRLRFAIDPAEAHGHAWTDAIGAAVALAFLGASWIALVVTGELFALLKITLVKDAIRSETFDFAFSGAALGAALSTLREQRRVVATLQLVAMTVLALLALPLAIVLAVFLGAMVLSGPDVLWAATRSATPVLMGSAIGAFLLANAVLRDRDADLPRNRAVRLAGLVLALGILPLAVFAAVSMGTRISQRGLSPERLWALIAIALACAWGLAWWVAAARGRLAGWPGAMRRANVHMAFVALMVAGLLALPLFDFGAIATRNQLARLEGGKVSPNAFDYAALHWDFGQAGKAAIKRLTRDPRDTVRIAATRELAQQARYGDLGEDKPFTGRVEVLPAGARAPAALLTALTGKRDSFCSGDALCRIFLQPGGRVAAVLADGCPSQTVPVTESTRPGARCVINSNIFIAAGDSWAAADMTAFDAPKMTPDEEAASLRHERDAIERGDVRVAPAPLWQIYVGGKASGNAVTIGDAKATASLEPAGSPR